MSIDLDAVKRRYTETVSVIDKFGRAIKVGRLKPSEQLRSQEMGANASASNTIFVLCHCRGVDEKNLGFPENRAVVHSRIDMLEDEGIEAIVDGMKQLGVLKDGSDEVEGLSVREAAKNS